VKGWLQAINYFTLFVLRRKKDVIGVGNTDGHLRFQLGSKRSAAAGEKNKSSQCECRIRTSFLEVSVTRTRNSHSHHRSNQTETNDDSC